MYKNLLSINAANIGTVGVFESETDFRTGGAPLRTYDIQATPAPGQSMYDALVAVMQTTDQTNIVPPLTRLGFMSRFTDAELVGIELARMNGDDTQRATLTVLKESWMAATEVDVTDPRTQMGVGLLVQAGLLSPERAAVILAPVSAL
jgi:hypothetical protein